MLSGSSTKSNVSTRCLFFEMEFDRLVDYGCHNLLTINKIDREMSREGGKFGNSIDHTKLYDLSWPFC